MHTLFVREEWLCAVAARFHNKLLTVARAACSSHTCVTDARSRISGGQNFMRAAVTIQAGCRVAIAFLQSLRMETAIVSRLLIRMALRAGQFRRRCVVQRGFDVGVTVDASEHAVDRSVELRFIDGKAYFFAVCLGCEIRIAVTSKAFGIGGL